MRKYTYLIVAVIASGLISLVGEALMFKNRALGFWLILAILITSSAVAALLRWHKKEPKTKVVSAAKATWASAFSGLGCLVEAIMFAVYMYGYLGCNEMMLLLLTFGAFVVLVIPPVVIATITNIKESR